MPAVSPLKALIFTLAASLLLTSCGSDSLFKSTPTVTAMKDTPAVRLNYRYEADVPAPTLDPGSSNEARDTGVQADFDAARPQEILDKTIYSPDKKHVLAVYHKISDVPAEFRLDMYGANGQLSKKMTSDLMAVHFPDTIVWSPDSNNVAFVAMLRAVQPSDGTLPNPSDMPGATPQPGDNPTADESNSATPALPAAPTPAAPSGILTFRTEQIYIANADGGGTKALTLNEGIIYFYYAWSPDSSMLAALATTTREWKYGEMMAASKNEVMIPTGRPRVIEKNGRERRLDDNASAVRPVWSSDSTKVAEAFGSQIRIYDAMGTNPTQAAIPLRNELLISSAAYDQAQQRQLNAGNGADNANTQPAQQPVSTLPDEKLLVSFNPIIELQWTQDELLYLKTAYVKRMKNEADSVMSFARWHRLGLTVQPTAAAK